MSKGPADTGADKDNKSRTHDSSLPLGQKWQESSADMLLFDTFEQGAAGGTGHSFDWSVLEGFDRPFVLAGGLNSANIARAVIRISPWGVDLNSGVETDGVKDKTKISEIMSIIRRMK